jgi:hypothetical protein
MDKRRNSLRQRKREQKRKIREEAEQLNAFGRKSLTKPPFGRKRRRRSLRKKKNESASRIERTSDEKKSESKHKRERI